MFKPYIFISKCIVHTDHKPLAYVLKKTSAHPHLARWIIELQNFNITIEFIEGEQNRVADALSRANEDDPPAHPETTMQDIIEFPRCLAAIMNTQVKKLLRIGKANEVFIRNDAGDTQSIDLPAEQRKDEILAPIISFLVNGILPTFNNTKDENIFLDKVSHYFIDENYYRSFDKQSNSNNVDSRCDTPLVIPGLCNL